MNGIERNCDDICGASPAVLETQKNRAAVQLDRFTQNQLAMAVDISRGMQGDSAGLLFAASGLAIGVLTDPKSSDEDRKSAWYFVKAVVPRGARAMLDHQETVENQADANSIDRGVTTAIGVAEGLKKVSDGMVAVNTIAITAPIWIDGAVRFLQSLGKV